MMSSTDSGHGDSIYTPKRVQKKLFVEDVSSRQPNHVEVQKPSKIDGGISGEESDLGPMSPLAVTDNSCDSLSGREYDSPFTTPERSPRALDFSWDRLTPSSGRKNSGLSPFSSLRKLTRDARGSPRRRIFPNSRRTPERDQENSAPSTPQSGTMFDTLDDTIVPETPQKDYNFEIPLNGNYPETRLITPLGSVCTEITVPPIVHRRKSICAFDESSGSSPERQGNSIKRRAADSPDSSSTKFMKLDEMNSIPKARASLFPEEKMEETPKLTPLSTKSFYSNTIDDKKRHSLTFGFIPIKSESRKRHSLPMQTHHRRSAGSAKRSKLGGINAGVKHGIKRPKPRRLSRIDMQQKKELTETSEKVHTNDVTMTDAKENEMIITENQMQPTLPRPPSPVEDPNKRFFKTNRTLKPRNVATVTVNDKIKLKVSDGKIALNKKNRPSKNFNPKPKPDVVTFDATDLTVDEPNFDTSMNQKDVAGILETLENDWADDEYDLLEPLSNKSPSKCRPRLDINNVLLSPATVLSTMTSSMNIDDLGGQKTGHVDSNESETSGQMPNEGEKKLFPLFSKGYTRTITESPTDKKTRGVKRPTSWQLSAKLNGGNDQYQLDVGQKQFGTTECRECGAVYQIGEPEDENCHLIFHNSFKKLKFNGWKNEHVVYQNMFDDSRIITIDSSDPKMWWKKVEEILSIVDSDLGLSDVNLSDPHDKKIYLYIKNKTIVGVLAAESVKVAHRMIPELMDLNCCSEEATSAKCGVNMIWTAMSHRRQGIARKLLDTLRSSYHYGYIMTADDLAFSIPTPSGKIFAEKYVGTQNFKVYS